MSLGCAFWGPPHTLLEGFALIVSSPVKEKQEEHVHVSAWHLRSSSVSACNTCSCISSRTFSSIISWVTLWSSLFSAWSCFARIWCCTFSSASAQDAAFSAFNCSCSSSCSYMAERRAAFSDWSLTSRFLQWTWQTVSQSQWHFVCHQVTTGQGGWVKTTDQPSQITNFGCCLSLERTKLTNQVRPCTRRPSPQRRLQIALSRLQAAPWDEHSPLWVQAELHSLPWSPPSASQSKPARLRSISINYGLHLRPVIMRPIISILAFFCSPHFPDLASFPRFRVADFHSPLLSYGNREDPQYPHFHLDRPELQKNLCCS